MAHIAARRGRHLHLHRRHGQERRVIDCGRVAVLRRDELRQLFERRTIRDRLLQHGARRRIVGRHARLREDAAAERQAQLEQFALIFPAQRRDGLLDLERIADGVAKRLIHVRDDGDRLAAGHFADLDHLGRELARIVQRLHKRTAAALDVQHDDVRTGGQLLGHDAADDERDARHGAGHVTQGVELLVRRVEVRRLAGNDHADAIHILQKALHGQIDVEARNALELVERAARVPEAAAGHLRHLHTEARHHRHEHERGLVAHAAGRVFVRLDAGHARQIQRLAAVHHGHGQVQRLAPVHAAEIDGHGHGGHLIIRDLPTAVAVDHIADLLRREGLPVALFRDQIAHSHRDMLLLCFCCNEYTTTATKLQFSAEK